MRFVVCIATAALWSQLAAAETIERRADASPSGEVEIVNVAGDVRVIGWDRPQVQVKADLDSDVEELEFEPHDDHTLIKVKWPHGDAGGGSSSLIVHVPRDSSVMVKTVSASQKLENVRGEQRLQSVSGEIETQIWDEDFQAKSVSGQIRASGHGEEGSARVTNVSGGVQLDRIAGDIDVNTVNGEIEIRGAQGERVRLKTTNGGIRFEGALSSQARLEAEAINGAIVANLHGKIDASFDIETFNGAIDNCFGPKPQRTSEYAPGNALRFEEGKGSARVRIKTLNGAVNLCRKP
jgi:DUF4097 and DUF4098 domain-containing protein YvlB